MSRAETLAGLAEVLAGHRCSVVEFDGCVCSCGTVVTTSVTSTDILAAWPKHQAAVALAWLEGQGWAEGAEE